ncbi:hypothetical protein HYC85_030304 [Camellia sinensis]|uniref:Putative plant transposon protein domain-containing protein n=1 Tax=Camellia sinensis TaxID=4442 RepID=A0A7J7G0C5_CAMSI|nr:hypothetical protein HYC85_030304 [Camellia sinensis]
MSTFKRRKSTASRPAYNTDRFPSAEKAKLYRESYSSRSIHLERNVHPSTFESISIRSFFDSLGGDHVLLFSGSQNFTWVREFYCNMGGLNDIGTSFKTWVRSKEITVTTDLIREILGIRERFPIFYPFPVRPTCDFDEVAQFLCGCPRSWPSGSLIKQHELLPQFRLLNLIVCANIIVTTHCSEINQDQGFVLQCIAHNRPIDLATLIIQKMFAPFERSNLGLPYGCLINRLLAKLKVPAFDEDDFASPSRPFTKKTVSQSQSHIRGVPSGSGRSGAGPSTPAAMVEEAEYDAAVGGDLGEGEQHPPVRTVRGQLQSLECSVGSRFDHLEARMDIFEARLTDLETTTDARFRALEASSQRIEDSVAQSSSQLSQILTLLQLPSTPPAS